MQMEESGVFYQKKMSDNEHKKSYIVTEKANYKQNIRAFYLFYALRRKRSSETALQMIKRRNKTYI